ncbi:TPA: hypothetical protein NKO89_004606 [Vibrio parahaemolyticus]|nr:hypothetical protein [Vibrio parahaemolyticus]
MSQMKARLTRKKVRNVKARRDVKRSRARKLAQSLFARHDEFGAKCLIRKCKTENSRLFVEIHDQLVERRLDDVSFRPAPPPEKIQDRILDISYALTQIYLHRAYKLFVGSFQSLYSENTYLMALSIRGFFESVAGMGYLLKKLNSYNSKHISEQKFDAELKKLLFGTRSKEFLDEFGQEEFEAINIMKMLDEADKVFRGKVMENTIPKDKMLRTQYEWLCEFCHPNHNSGSLSFTLDQEIQRLIFNHASNDIKNSEKNIISNLGIASHAFLGIFDEVLEQIELLKM